MNANQGEKVTITGFFDEPWEGILMSRDVFCLPTGGCMINPTEMEKFNVAWGKFKRAIIDAHLPPAEFDRILRSVRDAFRRPCVTKPSER